MKEIVLKEGRILSTDLVEIINTFREMEGKKTELKHKSFMEKVRKEVRTLEEVGINNEQNFLPVKYVDAKGEERPCYSLNRDGMLEMLNSESALVRYKTVEYINKLEGRISELEQQKANLLLAIYNGGQEGVVASKQLTEMEVKEATKPLLEKIENDKPLVTFADRVLNKGDNILIRELAKIISDEGYSIGQNKLYGILRDWRMIFKNSTEPMQTAIDRGYFVRETKIIQTPYGSKETFTTKVTPKGQVYITEKILKEWTQNIE